MVALFLRGSRPGAASSLHRRDPFAGRVSATSARPHVGLVPLRQSQPRCTRRLLRPPRFQLLLGVLHRKGRYEDPRSARQQQNVHDEGSEETARVPPLDPEGSAPFREFQLDVPAPQRREPKAPGLSPTLNIALWSLV